MWPRAILLILALSTSVYGTLEPQIVGGHDAPVGKFPYQASVWGESFFRCGGSLITENMVLTAAKCIYGMFPSEITVVVGTIYSNFSISKSAESYSVEKLIWHPGYMPNIFADDVGLIWLKTKITFTATIKPIRLASISHVAEGEKAIVTGWGARFKNDPIQLTLQEIELKVISQKQCQQQAPPKTNILDTHICTLTKILEGLCLGDAGGPLVINQEQVGIVSFGVPCARGYPDVYTNVYNYKKWMAKYTKMAGSSIEIDTNAANTVTKVWMPMLIATLTYLYFLI
ncbi:chymotrypsin-1-like [Augochlora pura]